MEISQDDDSFFRLKPIYGLSQNRGFLYVLITIILCGLISVLSLNYTDGTSILISMCAGFLFGLFLLNKVFTILRSTPSIYTNYSQYPDPYQQQSTGAHQQVITSRVHEITPNDHIIGFVEVIYADFGFVLVLLLFVMLAMIKAVAFK